MYKASFYRSSRTINKATVIAYLHALAKSYMNYRHNYAFPSSESIQNDWNLFSSLSPFSEYIVWGIKDGKLAYRILFK